MASRIQGITVEIGGDTTKLSKALEGVNKTIKGTQTELKDVNKLLKLDPSNTELVVQKQKMLKDAIQATKEKLATLKTAAQQANEQLANGEITQQQYDALQREIAETEQNLKSLQEQAATTNATLAKIDEAGAKLQNLGSSVENVGKKFMPVTAAVAGLGTAAVKTAADFDAEMSKVSAISGATGEDGDIITEKAKAGQRRFQNVDIKYKAFFFNGLPAKTAAVKAWLLSPAGYQKLQDTYDPDFFRMAVCKDALAFDVTAQKAAEMELTFNCKPQRWSVDGQRRIVLDGRTTLKNPFSFPAQPIFKVYGDSGGVLYVGEQKIAIHSIQDYVLLNCETHNAYNASGFCNETILSDDFPELPEGKTQIAWTGGIRTVEVIPRWWTL